MIGLMRSYGKVCSGGTTPSTACNAVLLLLCAVPQVAEASALVGELEDVAGLSREYQQSDQVYQSKVKVGVVRQGTQECRECLHPEAVV